MYVWGHSYEFDQADNWEVIERFCEYAGLPSLRQFRLAAGKPMLLLLFPYYTESRRKMED